MGTTEVAIARAQKMSPFRASLTVAWRRLGEVLKEIRRSKTAMIGLAILIFFVAVGVLAPWIAPHGPFEQVYPVSQSPAPPLPGFPLGIDRNGRDVYSQVIWGTQISLVVGIVSAVIASVLGTIVGLISGFVGGWIDEVIMRFNDIILSIPWLVLMIVVAARLGTIDLMGIILVIGLTGWSVTARVIRAQVLSIKERMFVERAQMIGSSKLHIVLRHIFPNAFPLIFANTILTVAISIISEAVLAFLHLGAQNTISWGKIISAAADNQALIFNPWWLIVPGICLVILVFGFYLFGFALDEILNPRLRRR